jgi:hypothetical protein
MGHFSPEKRHFLLLKKVGVHAPIAPLFRGPRTGLDEKIGGDSAINSA